MTALAIRLGVAALAMLLVAPSLAAQPRPLAIETPELQEAVARGELPPVAERLPIRPRVIDLAAMGRESGRPGGELRTLMGDVKDLRMMVVYGYSRLVGYNERLELVPDILERVEEQEGRIFTLRLRPGHKWSDGKPFTSEDFRYYWFDVANDPVLSPGGPPVELVVDGERATVDIIDETTVRYAWSKPNPRFLPALAGARPLFIYMPAHYLKQFHAKHRPAEELEALVKKRKLQNWARLHERHARQYRPENPELPVLDPWVVETAPPATRFVFRRNPYFHRVDADGRQLPYVSRVVASIVSPQLIPAKVATGETDLQARYIRFDNYTFLKEAERTGAIKVRLWEQGTGSAVALLPNLNTTDDDWRTVLRDVRVRRALSLGVNRREINMAIFYGLARESANTVIPRSPLYRDDWRQRWARFDLAEANRLLDEAGLPRKGLGGIRRLPSGRPAELIVETAGESTQETDVLSLVRDSWLKLGIRIFPRPTQRDLLRKRALAGETVMSVWSGVDDATPTADFSPLEFVPARQDQLQWPQWGLHYESQGKSGQAPDLPSARELIALAEQWRLSRDGDERRRIWERLLEINADQVFTIGTVNRALQPVVSSRRLRNVPDKASFAFEPGGYFGLYLPDTFWLEPLTQ